MRSGAIGIPPACTEARIVPNQAFDIRLRRLRRIHSAVESLLWGLGAASIQSVSGTDRLADARSGASRAPRRIAWAAGCPPRQISLWSELSFHGPAVNSVRRFEEGLTGTLRANAPVDPRSVKSEDAARGPLSALCRPARHRLHAE